MVSRDYTKELGLPSSDSRVSRPVALIILAAMAVGGFFAVKALATGAHHAPTHAEAVHAS